MDIFSTLEKSSNMKEIMINYEFPTSNLYPDNKYPRSRALNYIVENASIHRPSTVTLNGNMLLIVTFKINSGWFVAVQNNGDDLESNLDVYILPDREKFYGDLAYSILESHGCSGNMKNEADCVRCLNCNKILAVL